MRRGESPANANARMRPSGGVGHSRAWSVVADQERHRAVGDLAGVAHRDGAVPAIEVGLELGQRLEGLALARADVVAHHLERGGGNTGTISSRSRSRAATAR